MAVAAPDRSEPRWRCGGEVCRAVCHLISRHQYGMGPLETTGGCWPLSGMDENNIDKLLDMYESAVPGVHIQFSFLIRWIFPSTWLLECLD